MRVMRAKHAWRQTAGAGSVLGRARIVFAATSILVLATAAIAKWEGERVDLGELEAALAPKAA